MMLTTDEKNLLQNTLKDVATLIEQDQPLNHKDFSNEDLNVLYSLAYSLYQAGDYGQAKVIFQQLINSKPFKQKYWMGLAGCSQLEKSYEEALRAWSMAALIDEQDPIPHFHAAECLFSANDPQEGFKALNACKNRMTEAMTDLKQKIETLEKCWNKEGAKK